jgi:hypothetical protein
MHACGSSACPLQLSVNACVRIHTNGVRIYVCVWARVYVHVRMYVCIRVCARALVHDRLSCRCDECPLDLCVPVYTCRRTNVLFVCTCGRMCVCWGVYVWTYVYVALYVRVDVRVCCLCVRVDVRV